jgi:hypothetical protein
MALLSGMFDQNQYGGLLADLQRMFAQPQQAQAAFNTPQSVPEDPAFFPKYKMGNVDVPVIGQPQAQPHDAITAQSRPQPQQAMQAPQVPQPAQQQPVTFGDRVNAYGDGARAGAERMGGVGAMIGGISGFLTGDGGNVTLKALKARGVDENLARAAMKHPQIMAAILPQIMGTVDRTEDIKEYEYAVKKDGYKGSFSEWQTSKRAGTGEFGMTPMYGVGPDGKPAILQLRKAGGVSMAELPPGVSLAREPIKVEGPTGTVILDPQTRQQVGFIPKDVKEAAKQKEVGEAEGQALVNLPTTIATAENTIKTIQQMKEHPGKKNWGAFGMGAMLPDMPGGSTRGFGALVDQIKGQNFMTAFQSLKGAGAITEQEGAKAERAQARLDRAQSEKDFDAAIKDLEDVILAGMLRAKQKAGQPAGAAQPAPKADPLGLR